jgi:hypothetical protein
VKHNYLDLLKQNLFLVASNQIPVVTEVQTGKYSVIDEQQQKSDNYSYILNHDI